MLMHNALPCPRCASINVEGRSGMGTIWILCLTCMYESDEYMTTEADLLAHWNALPRSAVAKAILNLDLTKPLKFSKGNDQLE